MGLRTIVYDCQVAGAYSHKNTGPILAGIFL